jgi:hypothetical protein
MFVFNERQNSAAESITRFLGSDDKFFLLEGDPGTGKTTIISKILDKEIYRKKKIAFCATTNKAVSILEQYSTLKGNNIIYTTIQKLLNIKRNIDEAGRELYTYTGFNRCSKYNIKQYNIVLIDESSMICEDMLEGIMQNSKYSKVQIIFIGDRNQLPPVNEKISNVFNIDFGKNRIKLDKIERFRNDIMKYTNAIKNNQKPSLLDKRDVSFIREYNKWIGEYMEHMDGSIILTYTNRRKKHINNSIRALLFPGKKEKYNIKERIVFNNYYGTPENTYYSSQHATITDIQEHSYKFNPMPLDKLLNLKATFGYNFRTVKEKNKTCPICLEEDVSELSQLKCDHMYCESCIRAWLKENNCCPLCRFVIDENTIQIRDNTKITGLINDIIRFVSNITFKTWKIRITSHKKNEENKMDSFSDYIYVMSDDSCEDYNMLCSTIKQKFAEIKQLISSRNKYNTIILKRLWEFFYTNYIDVLADIDYGYCITVHKSQGSTYRRVYVNIMDIIKNNTTDTKCCVYTAVTRASDRLVILKT